MTNQARFAVAAACALAVAAPAAAQDKSVRVSLGYAFLQYLEEGGGNTPLGFYLSVASTGGLGLEGDIAWHRESEDFFDETLVLNTVTATLGPRFTLGSGAARPFLHALGGLRYDSIEGESNTSFGGMAGGGIDVPIGQSVFLRVGADFQVFFDEGENVKTLRFNAGISF